jgi:hypothetical protein
MFPDWAKFTVAPSPILHVPKREAEGFGRGGGELGGGEESEIGDPSGKISEATAAVPLIGSTSLSKSARVLALTMGIAPHAFSTLKVQGQLSAKSNPTLTAWSIMARAFDITYSLFAKAPICPRPK